VTAVEEGKGIARYRSFLAVPHTRALFGWALLARLPLGMAPLALLLLVRAEGASYAAAGGVVAAYGLALAGGALVSGRLIDRRGPSAVLTRRALAYPTCFAVVIGLALADAPIVYLGIAAAAAGAVIPPVSSSVRSIWPQVLPDELRSTAYSLEAAFQEIIFVVGPILAAALAALEPSLAVGFTGAATLVGTLGLVRLEPIRLAGTGTASGGGLLGALEAPGLRTLVVYAFTIGIGFGAVEVTMPAFAEGHGAREYGGLALAAFSAGSFAGGLLAGGMPGGDDRRRLLRYVPILGLALIVFQLAWSIPSLCVLAFFAGLPIAPTVAAVYGLIDKVAPSWAIAESFAWFGTSVALGLALGTGIGGAFVDGAGIRWSLAVGPVATLIGAAFVWLRRSTLSRLPAT
jgi:MFS family permease